MEIERGEIIFDQAYIDKNNVIKSDEAGSGYLLLTQTFDLGRAMVGATSVGIARAAYQTALARIIYKSYLYHRSYRSKNDLYNNKR